MGRPTIRTRPTTPGGRNMDRHPSARAIHDRLGYPVIDADGHYVEFGPSILEYLREVAGERVADALKRPNDWVGNTIRMTPAERREAGIAQEAFWVIPAKNTLDRATAILPRLLHDRLDELGFDFTVLYPSAGLLISPIEDEELRRATCRAFNRYVADQYRASAGVYIGITAAAIDELEYAVGTLGLKAAMLGHP